MKHKLELSTILRMVMAHTPEKQQLVNAAGSSQDLIAALAAEAMEAVLRFDSPEALRPNRFRSSSVESDCL